MPAKTFDLDTRKVWCPKFPYVRYGGGCLQKRDISDYGIVGAFLSLASTPHPQFTNTKSNVHMYIFCYCCYRTKSLLEAG